MKSDLRVAIHQPNFLPWMGYFQKILQCDVFVILDDVDIPKKGGSWFNRVQVLIGGRPQWISVPIQRGSGPQRLNETKTSNQQWRTEIAGTIQMAYSRASNYKETMDLIEKIFAHETEFLSEWNINSIQQILTHLDVLCPEIVLSSDVKLETKATERLRDLISAVGGTTYLCGNGSSGYLNESVLRDAGIGIEYQKFNLKRYPQLNTSEFEPGLSVIDALMIMGKEETISMVEDFSK